MALEFHKYLKDMRVRYTSNTRKLCLILKLPHTAWSKIERGINPPPKPTILKLFSRVVQCKSYEEVELFALAKRWKPSPNTNRPHELLVPPAEVISILGDASTIAAWRPPTRPTSRITSTNITSYGSRWVLPPKNAQRWSKRKKPKPSSTPVKAAFTSSSHSYRWRAPSFWGTVRSL